IEKPTFWIDKDSAAELDFKAAERYKKYKAKNIRIGLKDDASRSKHVLVSAKDLSLGYGDTPLFSGVNIDLREGESVELRGRNGAGKTTLIKKLLSGDSASPAKGIQIFNGELKLDPHARVGVYEQEVSPQYFSLTLHDGIERLYLD